MKSTLLAATTATLSSLLALKLIYSADASRALGWSSSWTCPPPPFANAALLVTGAGTGIARLAALRLARAGWLVVAGCLTPAEVASFADAPNVQPILLDVTLDSHVAAAVVHCTNLALVALVHSANAFFYAGPIEFAPDAAVDAVFNVSVRGALRLIRGLMPQLRKQNHARIVLVSSGAGLVATPFNGPYTMAKFALEALGDVLRREQSAVAVTLIEYPMVYTEQAASWPALLDRAWQSHVASPAPYMALRQAVEAQHVELVRTGIRVEHAARAMAHACSVMPSPPHRYLVGLVPFIVLIQALPSWMGDWILRLARGGSVRGA